MNPTENPLFSAWVQFLAAKSARELEVAAHSIPEINQLVGELNKMSADKEFIDLLNKNEVDRVIAQRTNAQALRDARDEGKAEGKAEGTRQALLNSIHTILSRKISIAQDALDKRLSHRSITELESLLSAALDFTSPADLDAWEKSNLPRGT
ncbi:MAG: hypothetical protein RL189_3363 [Pseudomonadota bacterium]